jgi:hypothetical protein
MTEADIQRLNFAQTSSLFTTFQSAAVAKGVVLNKRGFGVRQCPFRIFVDGAAIRVQADLDADLPAPSQIAGIELYANSATVPIQYATSGGVQSGEPGGAACGVILLWTKR